MELRQFYVNYLKTGNQESKTKLLDKSRDELMQYIKNNGDIILSNGKHIQCGALDVFLSGIDTPITDDELWHIIQTNRNVRVILGIAIKRVSKL